MKHVIIGTAGHIDHGKTTLIKALTGRNTDRLKEEQDRGISIELGFTYFDLPSGQRAGIIDVPGHEKFIKNMLAGVIGIDIVLLVVAADEGIMPQTVEHLAILDLLGIKKGFIVLTKLDLVDEEWIELVEEEVHEEIIGTFLENAPIIRVSSTKGEGIEEAIKLIDEYAAELDDREITDMPRLPVDRVFSISGFGTVVTGTLLAGKFEIGDEVQIFPGEEKARIRTLQVHDKDAETAYGGQRVAINLAGVKKENIHRGSVVAPIGSMTDTMMLDVKIKLLKSLDRAIDNRTRLKLYLGTEEILCRIVLLDKEQLLPGEEAYAQLRLEERVVGKRGDKFILRFYSPMFTIGGGEILEPNPDKKKRFDEDSLEELKIKELGDSKDILENIIRNKDKDFSSLKDISNQTGILEENINNDSNLLVDEGKIILFSLGKDQFPIHLDNFNHLSENIINEVQSFHDKHPLRSGISREEIRSKYLKGAKPRVSDLFIEKLITNKQLEQNFDLINIAGFTPTYTKEQQIIKDGILRNLHTFLPPKKEEIIDNLKIKTEDFDVVYNSLLSNKEIVKVVGDVYLKAEIYNEALLMLRNFLEESGNISIAEYRDLLNTNRRVALGLLEYFDQLKITRRDGEKRTLNK